MIILENFWFIHSYIVAYYKFGNLFLYFKNLVAIKKPSSEEKLGFLVYSKVNSQENFSKRLWY